MSKVVGGTGPASRAYDCIELILTASENIYSLARGLYDSSI